MRHLTLLVLSLASLPAAAAELLPYDQANRIAPGAARAAVLVDQSVYDRFAQQARGLNAATRDSLRAQFTAQRDTAVAAHDSARAVHYTRLIAVLQSISGS
jgi:hypothetical protein